MPGAHHEVRQDSEQIPGRRQPEQIRSRSIEVCEDEQRSACTSSLVEQLPRSA
jgi:hypothetical protein